MPELGHTSFILSLLPGLGSPSWCLLSSSCSNSQLWRGAFILAKVTTAAWKLDLDYTNLLYWFCRPWGEIGIYWTVMFPTHLRNSWELLSSQALNFEILMLLQYSDICIIMGHGDWMQHLLYGKLICRAEVPQIYIHVNPHGMVMADFENVMI